MKIKSVDVSLGTIKRQFTCCEVDASDSFAYCGTRSGDFLEIDVERAIYKRVGPVKNLFGQGVNTLALLPNGDIVVGSGDGKLAKVSIQTMQVKV